MAEQTKNQQSPSRSPGYYKLINDTHRTTYKLEGGRERVARRAIMISSRRWSRVMPQVRPCRAVTLIFRVNRNYSSRNQEEPRFFILLGHQFTDFNHRESAFDGHPWFCGGGGRTIALHRMRETLLIAIIKSAAVEELIEQFTVDGSWTRPAAAAPGKKETWRSRGDQVPEIFESKMENKERFISIPRLLLLLVGKWASVGICTWTEHAMPAEPLSCSSSPVPTWDLSWKELNLWLFIRLLMFLLFPQCFSA